MSIWNTCRPCNYREPFAGEENTECPFCQNPMVMTDDYGQEKHVDMTALEIAKMNVTFPEHIMSGAAETFATVYSSILESPRHFFYMTYLACLGSVLADKLRINSVLKTQPRMFMLILGESADVRKSTAIDFTTDLFEGMINICHGVGSAEGLQNILEEHNNTVLCLDEFKSFVSKAGISSSVLLPCVNTLFESNHYSNATKHNKISINNAYLTMLAASTVGTYERTWSSEFTDIGFNNRIFIVPGDSERNWFLPPPLDKDAKYLIQQELAEIVRKVGDGLTMNMSSDAAEIMQNWYKMGERSEYTKRIEGYAIRLLMLLSVNDGKIDIDEHVARKVIDLVNWQIAVRKQYDPIDADNEVAKMESRIRREIKACNGNGITNGILKKRCHYERSGINVFNSALNNLESSEEIVKMGRRPNYKWHMAIQED